MSGLPNPMWFCIIFFFAKVLLECIIVVHDMFMLAGSTLHLQLLLLLDKFILSAIVSVNYSFGALFFNHYYSVGP